MDIISAIKTRRSVRKYKPDPVSQDQIIKILEAGNLAPSATNRQPWEFVVVSRRLIEKIESVLKESFRCRLEDAGRVVMQELIRDMDLPGDINDEKLQRLESFYRTLGGAPVMIGVCLPRVFDDWIWRNYLMDAAAVIENILLAAWSYGLGTCWLTGPLKNRAEEIGKLIGLPDHLELVSMISLGYPAHEPKMPPKKKIIEKIKWVGFAC